MHQLTRGVLIVIEGIDGSGKSTLARNLHEHLTHHQFPTLLTKEPGGSTLGKQLREILQHQTEPLDPKAEYLLFAADRAQHIATVVQPALAAGHIVISDRMGDSSVAYQGYGRQLDIPTIQRINRWAMNDLTPDITMYIHISPDIAYQRIIARNDRLTTFEQERKSFIQRLAHGFDEIFKNRTDVIRLDGTHSVDQLTHHATDALIPWIQKHREFTR